MGGMLIKANGLVFGLSFQPFCCQFAQSENVQAFEGMPAA